MFSARYVDPYAQIASDAGGAHGGAASGGADALLGQEGPARAAIPPRHDARQALRLHRAARCGAAALSAVRHQHAGALCARDLGLPLRRRARRRRADRRPDPVHAATIRISTSSKARRCSKADIRRRRSRRCAARCSSRPMPRSSRSCWRRRSSPPTTPRWRRSDRAFAQRAHARAGSRRTPMRSWRWPIGRKGDLADADLASAQAAFARGDNKTARELAARAKTALSGRLARLGQGRRHRCFQQDLKPAPTMIAKRITT